MVSAASHPRRKRKRGATAGSPSMLVARDRELKAIDLRLKGHRYAEIGERLGCSEATAYRSVIRYLERTADENAESREHLRQIEVGRLDVWLLKLDPAREEGDAKAIEVSLKLSERRARLLGLDDAKPAQVNIVILAPSDLKRYEGLDPARREAFTASLPHLLSELESKPVETVEVEER